MPDPGVSSNVTIRAALIVREQRLKVDPLRLGIITEWNTAIILEGHYGITGGGMLDATQFPSRAFVTVKVTVEV